MGLKENIKKKRLELNLTLNEVSKKLSISKPTLQRYESGVISNIPSDKIEQLAKIFNTKPSILMGWEDESEKFLRELTKEQEQILIKYERLDYIGKHTVNTVLEMEFNRCK